MFAKLALILALAATGSHRITPMPVPIPELQVDGVTRAIGGALWTERMIEYVVQKGEAEEKGRADAERARRDAARRTTPAAPRHTGATVTGPCGGATNGADQFIGRESKGDPNIWNTQGSGAYGCYQIMPQTWASSCADIGTFGAATPQQQAACASRLPLSAWGG